LSVIPATYRSLLIVVLVFDNWAIDPLTVVATIFRGYGITIYRKGYLTFVADGITAFANHNQCVIA
jgi:hypothetical protein